MRQKSKNEESRSINCPIYWKTPTDLMSRKAFMSKYVDPVTPIVYFHIKNILNLNTLIYLGDIINIMTKYSMEQLQLYNIHPTPTVLELTNRSKI